MQKLEYKSNELNGLSEDYTKLTLATKTLQQRINALEQKEVEAFQAIQRSIDKVKIKELLLVFG